MIISSRDSYSYIHPSILKKIEEKNRIKNDIVNIQGFDNYTDEKIAKLEKLFNEGKIDSRPIKKGEIIRWINADDEVHRKNNLPAIESKDHLEYFVNDNGHRDNGPSKIYRRNYSMFQGSISWEKDGRRVADFQIKERGFVNRNCTDKNYEEQVRMNFPEVGNNIWPWNYMDIDKDTIEKLKKDYEDYKKEND